MRKTRLKQIDQDHKLDTDNSYIDSLSNLQREDGRMGDQVNSEQTFLKGTIDESKRESWMKEPQEYF